MATANIALNFSAEKGLPTLDSVLTKLQQIKTMSQEKINISIATSLETTGKSINTITNQLNKMSKVDFDKINSGIKAMRENLEAISKLSFNNLSTLSKIKTSTISTQTKQDKIDNFRFPYQDIVYGGIGLSVIKNYFQETLGLEKAVYDLGVVSEKSNSQIKDMYETFLKMSQSMPVGAERLTQNITEIARIGFSLEQAIAIGSAGAKFAIASGDKIEGVTDSLGKVILALDLMNVSEQEVTKITDQMQSVLLKTPLSTQTLSEGMRHASSAMAVFTQNSTRIGEDLENYKKEVLTTTLSLEGAFSRIGRTGSQSGLHIREMYTKLIAMDKAAKAMFNENTLGLYFDEVTKSVNRAGIGTKISSESLTSLAEQDLPKAIELLSKLYIKGEVTSATLKKMFTERLQYVA